MISLTNGHIAALTGLLVVVSACLLFAASLTQPSPDDGDDGTRASRAITLRRVGWGLVVGAVLCLILIGVRMSGASEVKVVVIGTPSAATAAVASPAALTPVPAFPASPASPAAAPEGASLPDGTYKVTAAQGAPSVIQALRTNA